MSAAHLIRELLHDIHSPLYGQHFGQGQYPSHLYSHHLEPSHLVPAVPTHVNHGYLHPWRQRDTVVQSDVFDEKDSFKVSLDVHQFKPNELSVKVIEENVVVEGNHEERSDEHGFISRHFKRRYRLPETVDKNALQSTLSSDGFLQLYAPKVSHPHATERNIPIKCMFHPAVRYHAAKSSEPVVKDPEPGIQSPEPGKDVSQAINGHYL